MDVTLAAVIPSYNRATLLKRAIESVLAQRRRPDEIVVVDDGSTDDTPDVVAEYEPDINFVRKKNEGVSSARNEGVRAAGTEFVAFLDSDDLWYPDHLARMENAIMRSGGAADLYFSDLELEPSRGGGSAWSSSRFSISGDYVLRDDPTPWVFLDVQPMWIQASIVRRDAYLAVGGCDHRLTCREDTHLFFKLGLAGSACAVAGCAGVLSGESPDSLTRTFSSANATYWRCTALLYGDLLDAGKSRMTIEQRRTLARRLADAHWMLARDDGLRVPRDALHHLRNATRLDPGLVPRRVARRLAKAMKLN